MRWFKQYGLLYLPISVEGWMVTVFAMIFMVPVCFATLRNGHSVSDDLYQLFVYGTCTAFWWKWIAEKTSTSKHGNTNIS
ncbi:MAG: hypothetical protein V4450_16080 [Bacteroidota bacterium]